MLLCAAQRPSPEFSFGISVKVNLPRYARCQAVPRLRFDIRHSVPTNLYVGGGPELGVDDDNVTAEAIELRVNEANQLFDSLDPFPFREKDLNEEKEEGIVSWAREISTDRPIKIIIQLPEKEVHTKAASELAEAFARYFNYRADLSQRELNELYRAGRRFLAIGMRPGRLLNRVPGRRSVLAEGPFRSLVGQNLRFWVGSRIGVRLKSSFTSGGRSHAAAIYSSLVGRPSRVQSILRRTVRENGL